jgi:hypothetical protein
VGSAAAWAAFPRRPLHVRASARQRAFLGFSLAVALACEAGAAWFAATLLPPLLREGAAWPAGAPVAAGPIAVHCHVELRWLPLASCAARGTWTDLAGRTQPFEASIVTLVGVDRDPAPELRLDPARPGLPMLSTFVAERPLRSAAAAVLVGGLAFLGAVVAVGAWLLLRDLRAHRALARNPWPVEARVVAERIVGNPEWAREIRFRARLIGGRETETVQRLAVVAGERGVPPERWTDAAPVALGGDPTRLLALVDDRRARLVLETLAPFDVEPAERDALLAAAARPEAPGPGRVSV